MAARPGGTGPTSRTRRSAGSNVFPRWRRRPLTSTSASTMSFEGNRVGVPAFSRAATRPAGPATRRVISPRAATSCPARSTAGARGRCPVPFAGRGTLRPARSHRQEHPGVREAAGRQPALSGRRRLRPEGNVFAEVVDHYCDLPLDERGEAAQGQESVSELPVLVVVPHPDFRSRAWPRTRSPRSCVHAGARSRRRQQLRAHRVAADDRDVRSA